MIIVLERTIREQDKNHIREFLSSRGYTIREIVGEEETILGAVGITGIDIREVELLPGVARVIPISSPYKLASREFRKDDTVISLRGPAGTVAHRRPADHRHRGAVRRGVPRSRPWSAPRACANPARCFSAAARGSRAPPPTRSRASARRRLKYLKEAGEAYGMPVVSEIVSPEHVDLMRDYVDVLQIGARNMQNFELLKRVGSLGKPVLLEARPCRHHPGPAHVRGVPAGRGHRRRHPLRARASAPSRPPRATRWTFPPSPW